MTKPLTLSLCLGLALVSLIAVAVSSRAADDKPLVAFNGKNLDGFYTFVGDKKNDPTQQVFSVTDDGLLRIAGAPRGYLSTEKVLSDYRMVAEFKWGEGDTSSDSGIFFHAVPEDRLWSKSLEVQMRWGATGDLCLIGKGSTLTAGGKKWDKGCIPRPGKGDDAAEIENPRGEWNTIELSCKDDRVRVMINGKPILDGTAADPSSGRVYFQCFKGELFYRRIAFYPLSK